ncbi:DNA-3-methyladenine glycosylase 2 family protein [Candidatus Parcubacteria bacterium]|nr:MAG: DNA-3-methyladenine glycosylase 2 family protein [Candidatus Parcubacteria bacterium]
MVPIKLTSKTTLDLIPIALFDFDSSIYKPGHFPTDDTKWESGKRWQTMLFKGKKLGLIFINKGVVEDPKIKLEIYSEEPLAKDFLDSLIKEIRWRFNLDLNLSEFYKEVKDDELLDPIVKKFRGLRPMHPGSFYEYLIISIVLQNTTVRRSVYMMQTLFEKYGDQVQFGNQLFWCFWEPEVLARANEQNLRDLKMGYRAKSLIRVSQSFSKGELDEQKLRSINQEEQEKILLSLYGIGPASVGYIMFDVFHHWDFLKNISPWEQKIYTHIFFNKDHEKELVEVPLMLEYFKKWGKWKGLAVNYVWEDIWWKRKNQSIPWLEKEIRL